MGRERVADLAELLYRFRIAAGFTQEELAERSRMSARAISDLERGVRTRPHVATVRQLADALQLSDEERSTLQLAARRRQASQVTSQRVPGALAPPVGESRNVPAYGGDRERERQQRLPVGGFLGSLPSGRLVARTEEIDRVRQAMETVAAGQGRLLLLAGEAGIGKTRLAQELTRTVHERGFLVAAGRCYEPHQAVPYYPFLEALRMAYSACLPVLRDQVPHRWPYLARLMPDQLGPGPAPSNEAEDQERLFRVIEAFVLAIAEVEPIALLLDDLHWADGASLQLLQHLARQARGSRVLLVGTYRDMEVQPQHPLEATLRDLHREQLVERVQLGRLEASDTAAFIADTLGDLDGGEGIAALVHRHTDGNPFFTQQLLRALIENGSVYRDEGRWKRRATGEIEIPQSVRSVIGQRISRLRPEAQALLQEASVFGPAFAFDDLVAMKSRTEEGADLRESVDKALTDAATLGLVRAGENDDYIFDHVLTQQALYTALSPHRRRLLHVAAGKAIEDVVERTRHAEYTERAAELVWHFLRGNDLQGAAQYSLLAGDQAETVFALGEAEQHYRVAAELAQKLGDQSREREALEKLGVTLRRTGRYTEARKLLEQSAKFYGGVKDLEGEARVAVEIAYVCVGEGQGEEEAIQRLQALVETLNARDPSQALGKLYATLAYMLFALGRYDDQLKAATRAADLGQAVRDTRLLATAAERRGTALVMLGRHKEARPDLEEAVRLAEMVNDFDVLQLALTAVGDLCLTAGCFEEANTAWQRALEVAERMGEPWVIGFALCNLSQLLFMRGEWDAASVRARRALELFGASAPAWYAAYALLHLGILALARGDREAGLRQLDECSTIARTRGDLQALRFAQLAVAEDELLDGKPKQALARLEPLLDRPGFQEENVTRLLACVAWAHLEMDDVVQAGQVLQRGMERAAVQDDVLARVELLRVRGMVLSRRQEWEEAGRSLDEAVSLAHSMPYPLAEAHALYEHGLMLGRQGERRRAQRPLEKALRLFRGLDARTYCERTEQALALTL